MYLSWLPARQKLSVLKFWKNTKISKIKEKRKENVKRKRKRNIVRKMHAKFGEAGACGCRDTMYLSWLLARRKRSVFWKFENRPKNENFKNQRKICLHNIVSKLHSKVGEAGTCGCRDMMYLSWLPARQKLTVFWKFEKIPKYQNFKNQRKMCPHNIVRKLHAKFGEAGACGCRDMMYLSWLPARQKLNVFKKRPMNEISKIKDKNLHILSWESCMQNLGRLGPVVAEIWCTILSKLSVTAPCISNLVINSPAFL